jgi:tocopherol O-methyltransferase
MPDDRSCEGVIVAGELGFADVKSADWSDNVAPFWDQVIQSALTPAGVAGMLGAGWGTLKGALVMPLMKRGYETGLIKFVAITGTKPR